MKNKNNNLSNEECRLGFIYDIIELAALTKFNKKNNTKSSQEWVEKNFNSQKLTQFIKSISSEIEDLSKDSPNIDQKKLKTTLSVALISKEVIRKGKGLMNNKFSFNLDEKNIKILVFKAFEKTNKFNDDVQPVIEEAIVDAVTALPVAGSKVSEEKDGLPDLSPKDPKGGNGLNPDNKSR